ncbi:unnamed protein product [Spirodela intermedia]|uniref:Chromo domain-containing protein n=1 Tax=Spirodela intermedia TaxID=51605 RepID=A0A7I8K530_SPIIN|nr:unnamed protein product [Spirodela intermedia]
MEVLIKWKGLPDFEATWEAASTIHHQFPDFHLVDKVEQIGVGEEGGFVRSGTVGPNTRPNVRVTSAWRGKVKM